MDDIIVNELSYTYMWESLISKLVSKIVRHEGELKKPMEQNSLEIDTDGNHEFTDRDWNNCIWEGNNKTSFPFCQNSREKSLYIRAI